MVMLVVKPGVTAAGAGELLWMKLHLLLVSCCA